MTIISSDTLNPMLVRDLRQGLRSSRFTLVFLLLQLSMAFFVTMGLLSDVNSDIGPTLTHSLMVALILFYILGLPMAATFAFTSEFSENRIDLLKLTQMSARSLLWGKWLSLFLQGLMVFASLLPYLILTYFFGQVDIALELFGLVVLLAVSALLVGLCVVLSCFRSVIFQILVILVLLYMTALCMNATEALEYTVTSYGRPTGGSLGLLGFAWQNSGIALWLYVLVALPAFWLLMEYGAARLAPFSENHDTPQRVVLLALIACAGLSMMLDLIYPGTFIDNFTNMFFILGGWVGGMVLVFASSSEPSPYPDTYRPFLRFGLPGKFIGRAFLYPGWPSAIPFTMLATGFFLMLSAIWYSLRQTLLPDFWLTSYLLAPPAVLFPQLAGWLVLGRTRLHPMTRYFSAAAFCLLVYVVCAAMYEVTQSTGFIIAAAAFPPDAWFLFSSGLLNASQMNPSLLFTLEMLAGTVGGVTIALSCVRASRALKLTRELEARAQASLRGNRSAPNTSAANPTGI